MPGEEMEFLLSELARLDFLLHRQVLRLRARYHLSLDEFRGLYVSDQQVDSLVRKWQRPDDRAEFADLDERAAAIRNTSWQVLPGNSPWKRLASEFHLSAFEMDVVLLAFAPQIDLKYETIYAYLNNDVTRKWPTLDLPLHLLGYELSEKIRLRSYLLPEAKLFTHGLLQILPETSDKASWLAQGFSLSHSLSHYLLGHAALDHRLASFVKPLSPLASWEELRVSSLLRDRLRRVPGMVRNAESETPIFVLAGPGSAEKKLAAQAICCELGISLLQVDLQLAQSLAEPGFRVAQALALERRVRPAALYVVNAEALCDADSRLGAEAWRLLFSLTQGSGSVFVAVGPVGPIMPHCGGAQERACLTFEFEDLEYHERRASWEECLAQAGCLLPAESIDDLANRFVMSHSQVQGTVRAAGEGHVLGPNPSAPLALEEFLQAARAQSSQELGKLATKVPLVHSWDDLVLPRATMLQVRDVAAAVKYRHVVYSQWGFGQRLVTSLGLKVLFAGASGTGKTMTAGVLARDLGLDLYKIDLSTVVSKFIGETEKNLDRIFRAAQSSNSILFFDEADALFGRRSEVTDAHDRYANIEVAYLLQKMEDHDGVVILASNLSKNIDEAFSRRMHYVVEFPLPGEEQRKQLWRGMFPPDAPVADDVDFAFLARQFPISGGEIRNVVLAAAFLAAQNDQIISMRELIEAMRQQSIKRGKVPGAADFKQYHGWNTRSST